MKLIIKNGYAVAENVNDIRVYGNAHWELLKSYEDSDICKKITAGRIKLVTKYLKGKDKEIFDIGCGTGYFMRKYMEKTKQKAYGYDILHKTEEWLFLNNYYLSPFIGKIPSPIMGVTMWDSLEHFPEPRKVLDSICEGMYTFISMPIYKKITKKAIMESKHYRPREHLYYWSHRGLVNYMDILGFEFKYVDNFEIEAGRQDIYSYVFKKV